MRRRCNQPAALRQYPDGTSSLLEAVSLIIPSDLQRGGVC